MKNLYGFRNKEGEHIVHDQVGWRSHVVFLNEDLPKDYRIWTKQGIKPIVILSWGSGSDGTITSPENYQEFANLCSIYAESSPGCSHWIIGNKPNHPNFWPDGRKISPKNYATCYRLCRDSIHKVKSKDEVFISAISPWDDPDLGPGLDYLGLVLGHLDGELDGFAIHVLAHDLVSSIPDNIFTPFASGDATNRSVVASPTNFTENAMTKQAEYLREDEVILALRSALGNMSIAAKSLGLSRGQLQDYMVNHPAVREEKQEIKESLKDIAEDHLATRMMTNDNLLVFFLRTQARDRGYEPNLPLVGADGKSLSVSVDARSLISAMRQGFTIGSSEEINSNEIEEISDSGLNGT